MSSQNYKRSRRRRSGMVKRRRALSTRHEFGRTEEQDEADSQDEDSTIHMIVNRMGGDVLEFHVHHNSTVRDMKELLDQKLQVRPANQVLLLESAVMPACMACMPLKSFLPPLSKPCEDPDTSGDEVSVPSLTLTLVVSSGQGVASTSLSAQVAAIGALTTMGPVNMLLMLMQDSDPDVREAALNAIATVAPEGDERSLSAARPALEDLSPFVRRASLQALLKIGTRGDMDTLARIAKALRHNNPGVRYTAVEALANVAEQGDSRAIEELLRRLNDTDFGVRATAARSLASIAQVNDARVIKALDARILQETDDIVRKKMVKAVKALKRHDVTMAPLS